MKKVRLTIASTEQERMDIKRIANKTHMTVSECLLSFALSETTCINHCMYNHEPNEETAQVLRETDKNENFIEHATLEGFWEALGFNQKP